MIYFQTKPDAVFEAILEESLLSEMAEVKMLADDGAIDSWEGLYPETSALIGPYRTIRLMAQMLAAKRDAAVYQLTELHWLVLYECLQNFCTMHNDLAEQDPHSFRAVGAFRLLHLDCEAMVDLYFWDRDFLLRASHLTWPDKDDLFAREGAEQGSHDLDLHRITEDVPKLEMVEHASWIIPEPDAFFRTGSVHYPDRGA